MRRADRLFQIIQILRRQSRAPITAQQLAEELEVTPRTVYRDVADLIGQRVPIRGEAGMGYVLEAGYDMPPLMLTPAEIEAVVLGAQWVQQQNDPTLAQGANDLIAKIGQVVPDHLRPLVIDSPSVAVQYGGKAEDSISMEQVRQWIRKQSKIEITYLDLKDKKTKRIIWPISIAYFETVRLIVGWCEMRDGFRHFRSDRIIQATFLDEKYKTRTAQLRKLWAEEHKHSDC